MTHPSVLWKYQEYHIVHLSNRRRQDFTMSGSKALSLEGEKDRRQGNDRKLYRAGYRLLGVTLCIRVFNKFRSSLCLIARFRACHT